MANPQDLLDKLCAHERETALLSSIEGLVNWDERTKMPSQAGAYRAEQVAYLSGQIHRRRTDPQLGQWLNELADTDLASDPQSVSGTIIRQCRRSFDKQAKLSVKLVEELSRCSVLGQQAWVEARKKDDFAEFEPCLTRTYELKREQAEAYGYEDNIYDPLLDDFEPGESTEEVTRVLAALREDLVPLVAEIAERGKHPRPDLLKGPATAGNQEALGTRLATAIGFDFTRGRLDETAHPFCSEMGPHDCRITTHYNEQFFPSSTFSILHEAGHGLYQQGLPAEQFGLPTGSYVSLGIHESQSRLWENLVGRSKAFWSFFYPDLQKAFPQVVGDLSLDDFYFAINDVRGSLIRIESDEATYNLHIIIRFELEQALLSGDLAVKDVADVWRERYQQDLGISSPTDADGVLQDVHWSAGLVGYFPTYSLGNLYASQFYDAAREQLGDVEGQMEVGEFAPLRNWLTQNIHQQAQRFTPAELVEKVTGYPLSHEPLIRHVRAKYTPLYGLS